ncbi:MAG: hypothetical protein WCT10_00105 [Patescibacteria group bacterium]|jgi:hypothetical protein
MILLLDVRNDRVAAAKIGGRSAIWSEASGSRESLVCVDKLFPRAKRSAAGRPQAVVMVELSGAGRDQVSWSAMRSAVATANTLAFAWGVPVLKIICNGSGARGELAAAARVAASKARPGQQVWLKPAYGGEPHITQPRKV